jgi:predicted DNA-binding transcriptional regulator YafY
MVDTAVERKPRRKKEDDTTATMRRFVMLQHIPWEPATISTTAMRERLEAAGYTVEPRTVQRDLATFSTVFQYSSEARGNAFHWFWPKHCRVLNVRAMDPEAAMVLSLAERHLLGLLPSSAMHLMEPLFVHARESLRNQDPRRFSTWGDKVRVISRGPSFSVPVVSPGIQQAVFDALQADKQLKATYKGRGGQSKETLLHPLGIVSRDRVLYLVATAWDYQEPYQYALHRFDKAEAIADPARRPPGFELDRYINEQLGFAYPTGTGRIALKIEVDEEAALSLLERPLSSDQKSRQMRTGRYSIEATVEDTSELRWWILGFGTLMKVVGPARLRREISKTLAQAAAQYAAPA